MNWDYDWVVRSYDKSKKGAWMKSAEGKLRRIGEDYVGT